MTPGNKTRSRRLRKKLHIGEYKELGFEFEADLKSSLSPEQEESLADLFLSEVIEPNLLAFAGWVNGGYVARFGRGSVTEEQRQTIQTWLSNRPEYSAVRVGSLKDVWYPS